MDDRKTLYLHGFFNQVESQVQFGDNKASLLIAGDSILLAINGGVIKMVSDCPKDEFTFSCMSFSAPLALSIVGAALLVAGLACALRAARPARIHDDPPPEFFLLSHVARSEPDKLLGTYRAASGDDMEQWALQTIRGKAEYATGKFRWLKRAVDATLLSLAFLVITVVSAVGVRIAA